MTAYAVTPDCMGGRLSRSWPVVVQGQVPPLAGGTGCGGVGDSPRYGGVGSRLPILNWSVLLATLTISPPLSGGAALSPNMRRGNGGRPPGRAGARLPVSGNIHYVNLGRGTVDIESIGGSIGGTGAPTQATTHQPPPPPTPTRAPSGGTNPPPGIFKRNRPSPFHTS